MAVKKEKILVVEDNKYYAQFVERRLGVMYELGFAVTAKEALEKLSWKPDMVLLDVGLPPDKELPAQNMGLELLEKIKKFDPMIEVIFITGTAKDIELAVEAIKRGAFDYILKDSEDPEKISTSIKNALRHRQLLLEKQSLEIKSQYFVDLQKVHYDLDEERKSDKIQYHFGNIVGDSRRMQKVYGLIEKICSKSSSTNILITGETGTGKEMMASAIHFNSERSTKPLVTFEIPSLNPQVIESELFGHVKGAFTGAHKDKVGYFEKANGSTLLIDEIGEIPKEIQVKLLRAIDQKEIQRVGSTQRISVDVRVIAATNKDLEQAIKEGNFREDLYYRLNVIRIDLPPLRERKEDIPDLVQHFLNKIGRKEGNIGISIEQNAVEVLTGYDWPGNVRQLENVLERAVLLRSSDFITAEEIEGAISGQRSTYSTKIMAQDIDDERVILKIRWLPLLEDLFNKYNISDFKDIPNTEDKKESFLRMFVETRGNFDALGGKLRISHATVYNHFRVIRERIFSALCACQGNIELLADKWGVSAQDLLYALRKKNRVLNYLEGLLNERGGNEEVVAKKLDVLPVDLRKSLRRLREIRSG